MPNNEKDFEVMCEADLIYDQIESMLGLIAENNYDTVYGTCLIIKDDLLSLAKQILGADARDELEKYYDEYLVELTGEE